MPRQSLALAAASAACIIGALAAHTSAGVKLASSQIASSLRLPNCATYSPGDATRLFIIEQRGSIKIRKFTDATTNATLMPTFLDISAIVHAPASSSDERGMLGLAFHPNYQSNGYFYVYYIDTTSLNTVVARYTVSTHVAGFVNPSPDVADPNSAQIVISVIQPANHASFPNHKGGWIGFSPIDHFLYIGIGDGGSECDPNNNGQNPNVYFSKMLRIDVDNDSFPGANTNYAIPPSNPYASTNGGLPETWAWGLRNPYRCSFDRLTGDLWIGDVGQNMWEEVDYQAAGVTTLRNYGWSCNEGTHDTNASTNNGGSGCTTTRTNCTYNDPSFTPPIYEYRHVNNNVCVIGGYVYRGSAIPDLYGTYFFADYGSGKTTSFRYDGLTISDLNTNRSAELGTLSVPVSFGEDLAGELYVVQHGSGTNGTVRKIQRACTITIGSLADQTVCANTNASFTIAVGTPTGAVTYTWRHNGATFGAPSSPTLTLTSVQPADAGSYRVDVQDTCENLLSSNTAMLTVVYLGDLNSDCTISAADVPIFINVLLGLDTNASHIARANMDGLGGVDGNDIPGFVTALLHP